jgi:hypothetical protein
LQAEAKQVAKKHNLHFLKIAPAPKRTIGQFKGRVLKDALDVLALVRH